MKKRNPYLLILAIGLLVASCDPGVSYKRVIENHSSHDIWVKVDNNDTYVDFIQDSILIPKHTEKAIAIFSGLGQTFEFDNCGLPDTTLTSGLIEHDSLAITTNLNDASSWTFSVLKETFKQGGDCECRLVLTDNEIE